MFWDLRSGRTKHTCTRIRGSQIPPYSGARRVGMACPPPQIAFLATDIDFLNLCHPLLKKAVSLVACLHSLSFLPAAVVHRLVAFIVAFSCILNL